MLDDAVAQTLYQWQADRRKADSTGQPVVGFGPRGSYTLWLPDPKPTTRVVIRDGDPTAVQVPGALDDPKVVALRDRILFGFREVGPGVLAVPIELIRYASAVIRINYNVTDDDLTMLLCSEPTMPWGEAMFIHALGGEGVLSAFSLGGEVASLIARDAGMTAAPAVKRPLWRRLIDALKG